MITAISFCILNYGHSVRSLNRCIDSIHGQAVPRYETLACSSMCKRADVIYFNHEDLARRGELNKMRNFLCGRASNDFVALIDAGVELASDWYENIKQADWFDVAGSRVVSPDGERVVDWAYQVRVKDSSIPHPLHYDEWNPKAYVSGILMVIRRSLWEEVKFNEELPLNHDGGKDFCNRVSALGYRIGVFPGAVAVYHPDKTHKKIWPVTFADFNRLSKTRLIGERLKKYRYKIGLQINNRLKGMAKRILYGNNI